MSPAKAPSHTGNMGRVCLITPAHGETYVIGSKGSEWCPHSDHTKGDKKKRTPMLLSEQQKYLDARKPDVS